jgi:hypothetical protein
MSANFLFLPQFIAKQNGGLITIENIKHVRNDKMSTSIKNEFYSIYKNATLTKPDPKSG